EDHLQAVLVDEPTPVGGLPGVEPNQGLMSTETNRPHSTAADNHSHTQSHTVSQPAVQGSGSAIPIPLPLLGPVTQPVKAVTLLPSTLSLPQPPTTATTTPAATTPTPDTSAAQQQLGHLTVVVCRCKGKGRKRKKDRRELRLSRKNYQKRNERA
ncbi:hypothetical protein PPACK8108_LOCUS15191, partial [Phakopsora pachyrhizi]